MWNKQVYSGLVVLALSVAAGGCAVGQGAPEGWRYLRTGQVDVAHPKAWRETAAGAALHGPGGRTDAQLTVDGGADAGADLPGSAGSPGRPPGPGVRPAAGHAPPPASARKESLRIDGRPALLFSYLAPAPDGRPASWVNATVRTAAGPGVEVRAWVVAARPAAAKGVGSAGDPQLLREIVNSIELD